MPISTFRTRTRWPRGTLRTTSCSPSRSRTQTMACAASSSRTPTATCCFSADLEHELLEVLVWPHEAAHALEDDHASSLLCPGRAAAGHRIARKPDSVDAR